MIMASTKESTKTAYPKTLLSILASVGGLAVFLFIASTFLVSQPIGSTVHGYFYNIDYSQKIDSVTGVNETVTDSRADGSVVKDRRKSNSPTLGNNEAAVDSPRGDNGTGNSRTLGSPTSGDSESITDRRDGNKDKIDNNHPFDSLDTKEAPKSRQDEGASSSSAPPTVLETKVFLDQPAPTYTVSSDSTEEGRATINSVSSNVTKDFVNAKPPLSIALDNSSIKAPSLSPVSNNISQTGSLDSGCDLYHGKWVYNSTGGPLYTNNSCPVLTQMQNCQGNGRPDKEYENWRWKPAQCDLPRFDAKKFLELMRGKTLAFIGDSVARNQMESMLCILWQVEVPKNRGNKRMQRYFFNSTSTTIIRIWSSWLVQQTSQAIDFAPEGVVKLHLDAPDEGFMEFILDFDVIVLSSGHWFAKQSVYVLNNEIVGGQLWWPDKSRPKKVNNIEAFGISVETILSSLITHRNYTGLTIVRSYSPDHYEGGAWNTGGSCTGKVKPALEGELVANGFTNIMHEKQLMGFKRAIKKTTTNKSKLRFMDITEAFSYRHDGHPGPYRSLDPNKITKRGPDGRPPPQDCLHWCMPGPVDTWNELVLEIIRREFEGSQKFGS